MDGTIVYDWVSEATLRSIRDVGGQLMVDNAWTAAPETGSFQEMAAAVARFLTPRPTEATTRDLELIDQGSPLVLDNGLAATAWGEGPTVLLAHGWESRRSHWGAFVPALTAAGYRAVAVDAPAHGDSPGSSVNMPMFARALRQAGRQIGPLAAVIGHSFGAGAATMALADGLQARKAVLIAGPASITQLMHRWLQQNGYDESLWPEFVERVAAEVGQPAERFDLTRIAAGIDVPALLVHDRTDADVPLDEARALAAAWRGANLMITERFGHRRILIARPVVNSVVEFLGDGSSQNRSTGSCCE